MRILYPSTIASVTTPAGSMLADVDYPVRNLLHYSPAVRTKTATATTTDSFIFEFSAPAGVNSVGVVGVISEAATLTTTTGAAPAGLVVDSYDDAYYSTRKNYWMTFTTLTIATTLRVVLTDTVGSAVMEAGVLLTGVSTTHEGLQYPVSESMDDPTTTVRMADGSMYRGVEITPSRAFSGVFMGSHYEAQRLVRISRAIGGRQGIFHLAEDFDDSLFVYGRMFSASKTIQSPGLSSVNISLMEWV